MRFEEFDKSSARVFKRLRKLNEVRNQTIQPFEPEIRNFRRKTLVSDYFADEEALTAYIANFVRNFQ